MEVACTAYCLFEGAMNVKFTGKVHQKYLFHTTNVNTRNLDVLKLFRFLAFARPFSASSGEDANRIFVVVSYRGHAGDNEHIRLTFSSVL